MKDILEPIFTLLPLPQFLESLGLPKDLSDIWANIIVLFLSFVIPVVIAFFVKYLAKRRKTAKAAKSLAPYFDFLTVKRA